jgi:basic membrane protein A
VALLDAGADLITQHQDTTEPQKAAQERGLLSVGYDSDMGEFVGDSVLVSAIWNWEVYYIDTVGKAMNGNWETHQYWGGLKDGVVGLSDYSPKVSAEVKQKVEDARDKIESGSWDVFYGPVTDQNGSVVVPEGEQMSDSDMLNMSFFVEGVVGKIE